MRVPSMITGGNAMSHLPNAPRFEDLDRLSIGEIAALSPHLLLDLQEAALTETSRIKRLRERLEAGLGQRYGVAADAARVAEGKSSGTVRIEDGDVIVIAELPKKVTWDQDQLAAMAARIASAGDDPAEYLEIAYRVPERRFGAWPETLRAGFAAARTETTGKPVFRLETRDR